jgi:hypothetical protein
MIPGTPVAAAAGPDVHRDADEFDEQIAEALLADDPQELELEIARARSSPSSSSPVFANLDQARERFINDLQQLKEGESPAPYIENFLPAVLPVLRIAIRLIGRPKVVNFLAGVLGKLISNLVGPAQTPALSRAIVDAGLKLVSLEANDEDEARLARRPLPQQWRRRSAAWPRCPIMSSKIRNYSKRSPWMRSSSRRPRTFRPSSPRRRTENVPTCWKAVSMRRG